MRYGDASTFIEAGVPVNGIHLPRWSEQEAEGTIAEWLKREGDTFREGEPLVTIATSAGSFIIRATHPGTLWRIAQPEGSVVPVGGLVGLERPEVVSPDHHTVRDLLFLILYFVALLVMGVVLYLQHLHQ